MMFCCMRYLACLLLAVSAGFGTYAIGAVAWSAMDPLGAGAKLLFTIPVALAGMAVPGILGMLCFVVRGAFVPERKRVKKPIPQPAPQRVPPTPQPATATPPQIDEDELEVVLAA